MSSSLRPAKGAALSNQPTNLTTAPSTSLSPRATVLASHPITLGASTTIHPFAVLDATAGPIRIGARCAVWERARVAAAGPEGVDVGDDVVLLAAAAVDGARVLGDACRVGSLATVMRGAVLERDVVVAPGAVLPPDAVVRERGVVVGPGVVRVRGRRP